MRQSSAALALLLAAALAAPALAGGAEEGKGERGEKAVPFDQRWLTPFFTTGPAGAAAEKFRLEDWKGAAEGFARVARTSSAERLPALTMVAFARMNLGEWAAAGQLFQELHEKYPVLAPYHAHYAARCRLRQGDTAGALVWAAKVPPRSVLEAETVLIELDALAATQRWADLEAAAARFLERFPSGPRRAEASFHRAEALARLGRPAEESAAIYRRIWSEAPLETWARKAEERLVGVPDAGGWTGASTEEWLARGMIFFERNQNVEAEAAFAAALAAAPSTSDRRALSELVCKAQFHRAQSIFKQRQRARAAAVFTEAEKACREAANRDLVVKALYQGARCKANAGDRAGALAAFAALEAEAPDHSYADDARLRAAELTLDAGDEAQAAALLAEVPKRYPNGDQLGEALWRLALSAIRGRRWAEAHEALDENLRRIPREAVWYAEGRALYWKARVLWKQTRRKEALAFYTRAVREYPLSIYAFLSLERMRREFPDARRTLVRELRAGAKDGKVAWRFAPRPVFGAPEFRRAVELARLGLGNDARRELQRLGWSAPDTRDAARKNPPADGMEDVYWITAVLLDRGRSWAASHAIPRYSVTEYRRSYPREEHEGAWRLAYPRAFPELVVPNSKTNHVPEALELAIMREESAFNPRIESFANALGLTQMLVKTAQRFSDVPVSRETLLDPAKNVEIGSRFLGFLLEHFGGVVPLAVAGYNAGEAAVDRWLRERGQLELDEFLETIPYDETRNYTKRVLSSYLTYTWLYGAERPVPELAFSLKPPRPAHAGRPKTRAETRRPRR